MKIEVADVIGQWVQRTFLLWIQGVPIGDQADRFVHVQGCINWLKDFVEHPRDRFEASLFALPKEAVHRLLSTNGDSLPSSSLTGEQIDRAFSRFHISHVGMLSFDQVTLLLVEDEQGRQRVIWQQARDEVKEAYLPAGRMQLVASECVEKASAMLSFP